MSNITNGVDGLFSSSTADLLKQKQKLYVYTNQNENEKIRINENINELTIVLNRLVEKLDEDRSVKDHLIGISSILKNLGEQNIDKFSEVQNNLTIELRAISKQLSKAEKSENKFDHK